MVILDFALWVTFVGVFAHGFQTKEGCVTPQFVELGTTATVKCFFSGSHLGIFWYNSTDHINEDSLLSLRDSIKNGVGYSSGEFDIHANGSLIINNVSLEHDHEFTAVKMMPGITLFPFPVRVVVIAKPDVLFPMIQDGTCKADFCFIDAQGGSELICAVHDTRPSVTLSWFTRNVTCDVNITSTVTVLDENAVSSTVVKTSTKVFSRVLTLLVCKAIDPPPLLKRNESVILVQNDKKISDVETITKTIERGRGIQLICGYIHFNRSVTFLVWKKVGRNATTNLMYAAYVGQNYTHLDSNDYELGRNGALINKNINLKHEGEYRCTFMTEDSEGVTKHRVIVYVNPVPAYPIVNGCNQRKPCSVNVKREGKLTCTLKGIRPTVQLQWKSLFESSPRHSISFLKEETTVHSRGETFDVSITTSYIATTMIGTRMAVECVVVGTKIPQFDFSTKVYLIVTHDNETHSNLTLTQETLTPKASQLAWIIATVAITVSILVCGLVAGVVTFKGHRRKMLLRQRTENEENFPMMAQCISTKDPIEIKKIFIDQIKRKYKNQYEAVHPIPYIKDRLYCVNMVFIETGIQCLSPGGSERSQTWRRMTSYHEIFKDSTSDSVRVILEGEPGYGKSTLSLQLVYDWCNCISESPLRKVDIVIFLRLRQLGGVSSIYRAIKQFILPKDSEIFETDIEAVLKNCSSVAVVLDGFDEYPIQADTRASDIKNIIEGDMFQTSSILLTTRLSCLPPKYAPNTKRMKLMGFDDSSRDMYISKAVAKNDFNGGNEIRQLLKENPVLTDLCQVPLFFVMFAHMTYERQELRDCTSVTLFFRYIISCLHSHMRNKMDEDVQKSRLFENNHKKLNQIAFDSLTQDNGHMIIWDKERLRRKVGKNFYDHYVRTGILVEEEVIRINDGVETPISEHIQYKTEVRFFHKIFCEWYASHHLSNVLARQMLLDIDRLFSKLDPSSLEYVYRFASGLNSISAKKIIKCLKKSKDGDKFAMLCLMEQMDNISDFLDAVRQLCLTGITLSKSDSGLLQRSTIQLLDIAFSKGIPISCLHLDHSLKSVDVSQSSLIMTSNRRIAKLQNVKDLSLYEDGRDLTEIEIKDIVLYAAECVNLKTLIFRSYTLPEYFIDSSALTMLQCNNINVLWLSRCDLWYRLNLQSGHWESFFGGTKKMKINQSREGI